MSRAGSCLAFVTPETCPSLVCRWRKNNVGICHNSFNGSTCPSIDNDTASLLSNFIAWIDRAFGAMIVCHVLSEALELDFYSWQWYTLLIFKTNCIPLLTMIVACRTRDPSSCTGFGCILGLDLKCAPRLLQLLMIEMEQSCLEHLNNVLQTAVHTLQTHRLVASAVVVFGNQSLTYVPTVRFKEWHPVDDELL